MSACKDEDDCPTPMWCRGKNKCPKAQGELVAGDDLTSLVRQGWRAFDCYECGRKWEWPSRDRFSPSGENCPDCGEWLFSHANRADEALPVDSMGNLQVAWNYEPNAIAQTPPKTKINTQNNGH